VRLEAPAARLAAARLAAGLALVELVPLLRAAGVAHSKAPLLVRLHRLVQPLVRLVARVLAAAALAVGAGLAGRAAQHRRHLARRLAQRGVAALRKGLAPGGASGAARAQLLRRQLPGGRDQDS
jgi:hypothetical protein